MIKQLQKPHTCKGFSSQYFGKYKVEEKYQYMNIRNEMLYGNIEASE